MNRNKTLIVAGLTVLLTMGIPPTSAAGGDISFGIYFGPQHHHHHRPHSHYRRHPYPRYYRHDYYFEPYPYHGPIDPWAYRPQRRFKDCYFRHGRRYCRWSYY